MLEFLTIHCYAYYEYVINSDKVKNDIKTHEHII